MSGFKSARILVAGGAGFVGSNLVRRLCDEDAGAIYVVDNLLSSEVENVPADPRIRVEAASIADDRALARLPGDLDYVFHLACYHGNQSSIADPIADHENNAFTTLKLFDRLKEQKMLRAAVYAGAGCAVAEKVEGDARATAEDAPVSLRHDTPYSISKLIGEFYANYFFLRFGLPVVTTRFQNVYGPGEVLGAGRWRGTPHTVWRNVIPTFIWKSLAREALPLENGGAGTRDFVYVDDIVEGLCTAALRGRPGETYNLASGVETRITDLATMINELTGNNTPVEVKPARDWDRSGARYGSTDKSRRELGFAASTKIRDGLQRTIAWTRTNREWIGRCMARHARFLDKAGQV